MSALEAPDIRVTNIRAFWNDGIHNAFTDLCRFGNDLYLTFRSCPDGHMVYTSSRVRVFRSHDGEDWEQVFEFSFSGRDTRDPHFLVFQDTLFVYSGTWLVPREGESRDINDHLGVAAWTRDGATWHGPQALEGTYGHYIWKAATFGDMAYLCGRRKRNFLPEGEGPEGGLGTESALLESDDGLVWRFRSRFQEEYGDETAFLFEEDGTIMAVARRLGGLEAQICRSHPPYRDWERQYLDRYIGGPMLAKWGRHYLVGGRKTTKDRGSVTTLYWLVNGVLQEAAELPSGGDNSYPGFIQLSSKRALLSYYSSHETQGRPNVSAIYLADLQLT